MGGRLLNQLAIRTDDRLRPKSYNHPIESQISRYETVLLGDATT